MPADKTSAAAPASAASKSTTTDVEKLPAQVERLSGEVVELLETKFALLKTEIQEEATAYLRDGMIMGAGGLLAVVGFTLLSSRLPKGTGVAYMLAGGTTMLLMKNRMAQRTPVPRRSVEELKKDEQWLKNEM